MPNEADDFANLPTELGTQHRALNAAMVQEKDPHGEWSEGDQLLRAYAPAAIAKILIGVFHPMLKGSAIAYLWREGMKRRGQIILGKASTAGGKIKFFGACEFVIEFNWGAWQHLSLRERIALVDHELTHCATDGDSLKPVMIPHDVEEFGIIVRRWGLWKPDLEKFGEIVREASQLGLFAGSGVS